MSLLRQAPSQGRKQASHQTSSPAAAQQKPAAMGSANQILQMQRAYGNRAVMQLLRAQSTAPVIQRDTAEIETDMSDGTDNLAGHRAGVFKRRTEATFETGTLNTTGEQVGIKMEGIIGPDHPAGSAPNPDAHKQAFKDLHTNHPGESFVRGHLLNGDLGGPGDYRNLYPITSQANSHHYQYVEKPIKEWINDKYAYVKYTVDVDVKASGVNEDADFICEAYPIDATGQRAAGSGLISQTIQSRAGVGSAAPDTSTDSYGLTGALIEDASAVGDIEYQEGKMAKGYTPIEESQIDGLKDAFYYIQDHPTKQEKLESAAASFLGVGKKGWDSLEVVILSNVTVPPHVTKGAWNTLAKTVNKKSMKDLLDRLETESVERPRRLPRGIFKDKKHKHFGPGKGPYQI